LENPEWQKAREALAKIAPQNTTNNGIAPASNGVATANPPPPPMVPNYGYPNYGYPNYYNQYPPPYNYNYSYRPPVNSTPMVRCPIRQSLVYLKGFI
jgi:hypothetical protein